MNEKSLVIAIDCDDVLVPTAQKAVENYNLTYAANVDLANYYGSAEDWGVDDIRVASLRIEEYFKRFGHDELITPFPEAVVAVRSLSKLHKLYLVTGRADFMSPITQDMADTYFPNCFEGIVHTNYYDSTAVRSKGEVCRGIGARILVDDHIAHCESALSCGVEDALLLNQPWNQSKGLPTHITRCIDWNDITGRITTIARG